MKIKAAGKRLVVVEVKLPEPEKKGLLIMPDERKNQTVAVVAVGEEVDKSIEQGDFVVLLEDSGIVLEIGGQQYLSIIENQILAAYKE